MLLHHNREGDVRIDRDRIAVAVSHGHTLGCLVWRPGCFVHELRLGRGLLDRISTARALFDFAHAEAVSKPFELWDAHFIVSDLAMYDFAVSLGAIEEHPGRILTLGVRK